MTEEKIHEIEIQQAMFKEQLVNILTTVTRMEENGVKNNELITIKLNSMSRDWDMVKGSFKMASISVSIIGILLSAIVSLSIYGVSTNFNNYVTSNDKWQYQQDDTIKENRKYMEDNVKDINSQLTSQQHQLDTMKDKIK